MSIMTSTRRTIQNYAALMRISNLPTCLANVLTGAAIGMQFLQPCIAKLIWLVIVICCYYCGGMILNDLCDIKYDKMHKSDRPIVAGSVRLPAAITLTVLLFVFPSVVLLLIAPHAIPAAVALMACIILYDVFHKKSGLSVILMGLCRALVYTAVAVAVAAPSQSVPAMKASLPFSILLGFYTLGITVIARKEDTGVIDMRKFLSVFMPLAILAILFVVKPSQVIYAVISGVLFVIWMAWAVLCLFTKPPDIKRAVLVWLSGMCLVDMWFLTVLDQPLYALVAFGCFSMAVQGHKKISGT